MDMPGLYLILANVSVDYVTGRALAVVIVQLCRFGSPGAHVVNLGCDLRVDLQEYSKTGCAT
jgi:hypothetical protein